MDTKATGYVAAIAPSGETAVAAISTNSGSNKGGTCPAPTLKLGNSSVESSCVTKFSSSDQPLFSVQIGGATIYAIVLDNAGNVVVAGESLSAAGFSTTPGAYETHPPGSGNPILCKLRASDGHPLFCTFIDVASGSPPGYGLTVDAAGNTYIAGLKVSDSGVAVEQLNPNGTARGFLTTLVPSPGYTNPLAAAVDAKGDLYCLCSGLLKLDSSGTIVASSDLNSKQPIAIALDPVGDPEVVLQDSSTGQYRLRKYNSALSAVNFDTPFNAGSFASVLSMQVDPSGIVDIVGETQAINLTQVNPTQPCQPSALNPTNAFLVRADGSGSLLQSTYLQQTVNNGSGVARAAMTVASSGASVIFWAQGDEASDVTKMTLGPASATIALACAGNAASFVDMPLAPNEIASIFGAGIGPQRAVSTAPDAAGLYPTQAGDFQITFDGVSAPLLYASNGQVNVVTPGSLAGKSNTHVCAVMSGSPVGCMDAPVQAAAPGVFGSGLIGAAVNQVGADFGVIPFTYAAAVNQDGTINSQQNPASGGSVVSLFVTGLGTVAPSVADGAVTPVPIPSQALKISVWTCLNEFQVSCTIPFFDAALYAGPAPLEVEGLGQINVSVPDGPYQTLFQIQVTLPDGTQADSGRVGIWTK